MKLAIMQPYIFPYIGYFQLMSFADKFIIYDDVNFINKGWINRNNILINNEKYMFTVPLKNASQNVLIKDLELAHTEKWKKKFLKTIKHAYSKTPFFERIFFIINEVINSKSRFIIDWHLKSIYMINEYLKINTIIVESSSIYKNKQLNGQSRILDICYKEKCNQYINPIGGKDLYNSDVFMNQGIKLNFLKSIKLKYNQSSKVFVPWLSIIDVMMYNDIEAIQKNLKSYEIA
tara:strand:- start:1709 stop:2407 length:699 start_codon:yes stop_codon:yes gene_type:complete